MATVTKFYLHRGTANPPGTMPGSSALGGTPTVSASGASTLRWIDGTISAVAQTSAQSTTDGTANAQTAWHTRHVSAPLAAQTIAAQTITYSLAASEGNAASNFNPTIYISLWRPSTGAEVGAILAVGTITATEPGTTQTATSGTGTSTARTAQDGDVIVIETWRKSVAPGASAARTNTTFYDGTTEASTTNVASFVSFTNALTLLAIAPAPTAASLTVSGATPAVATPVAVSPSAAALTATGATPAVVVGANVLVQPSSVALTATGATPTVTAPAISLPSAAALTVTGGTPVVTAPAVSQPTAASLAVSGATPTVTAPALSQPTAASLALSGAVPAISAGSGTQVSPGAAALSLTGSTPTVTAPAVSQPSAASLVLTSATPAIGLPVTVTTTGAALTLTGATPAVRTDVVCLPTAAALAFSMFAPVVAASDNVLALPAAAALALAGAVPAVTGGTSSTDAAAPFPAGSGDAWRLSAAIWAVERARREDELAQMAARTIEVRRFVRETLDEHRRREDEWLLGLTEKEPA